MFEACESIINIEKREEIETGINENKKSKYNFHLNLNFYQDSKYLFINFYKQDEDFCKWERVRVDLFKNMIGI